MDITKKNKKRKLTTEDGKKKKLGVCYLGRIPPRMDPSTIRQMLSQFGEIERVYLAPQDPSAQVHPPKPGKFQRQNFSEGWVEFSDKRVAKRVANMLNGEQMGGKKRSAFYYDLWNIKYLSKFKWDDLTEEIAFKKATREQKLALEISAAKRERDFYLAKVDKARALSAIDERLKKKQKVQEDAERDPDLPVSQPKKKKQKVREDSERNLDLPVSQSKKKNQKVQQDSKNEPELPVNLLEKKVIRRFRQKTPVADNTAASKPRVSLATLTDLWNSSH